MDEKRAKAVVAYAVKQEQTRLRLRSLCFDRQLALLDDPARLKCVLTSRRAGKSYGCGLGLYQAALSKPYVNCLYIGLIRDTARNIMWEILKKQARDLGLGLTKKDFNETTLTVRLKNNSTIRLIGMDKDEDQMAKVLGIATIRVVIDEAASFRADLRTLIFEHLRPTTSGDLGDIWMTGTPGQVKSFFYDVTTAPIVNGLTKRPRKNEEDKGETNGWSVHKWNTFNNPHMKDQWEKEIADIMQYRPEFVNTPAYKHMYEGAWFIDESNLCYHYLPERNDIPGKYIPALQDGVIACDLGFNDDTSFVVNGWNDYDPHLYIIHAEKKTKMDITDVVTKFKELQHLYPWAGRLVVDGANKQAVEEMRRRHGLPLISTEKAGKADFIFQMDTDLRTGVIKLWSGRAECLTEEWSNLVWDKKAESRGRKEENSQCPNHASDAALYGWRYARNFWHSTAPGKPAGREAPNEDELNAWAKEQMNKMRRRVQADEEDGIDWSPD